MDSIGILGVALIVLFIVGYTTFILAAIGMLLVAVSFYLYYRNQQDFNALLLLFAGLFGNIYSEENNDYEDDNGL